MTKTMVVTNSISLKTMFRLTIGKRTKKEPITELKKVKFVLESVIIDQTHLDQYKLVCGFSAEQGVPIIYPQMLAHSLIMQYLASDHNPWPAMGTVHIGNHIEQYQPLNVGDDVRVELVSKELLAHKKGQAYSFDILIYRAQVLVWKATQTLLRVGVKNPSGHAFNSPFGSSWTNGENNSVTSIIAASNIGRRYAKVSGDRNPIHLSKFSAKLLRFKAAIAHGMWSKARALADVLPQQQVQTGTVTVDFKTPMFLPAQAKVMQSPLGADGGPKKLAVLDQSRRKPHLLGQFEVTTLADTNEAKS